MQRYYLVPSATTAKPGEAEALDVLAHILGRGSNSRLYQKLVVETRHRGERRRRLPRHGARCDALRFYGSPKPGISLPQLEEAIDAVIAERRSTTASRQRSSSAPRTGLIADAVYAQDNQSTLARWYGAALTTGSTVEQIKTWPDRLRAVTAEDVHDAAARWLDKRRSVTGYLIKDSTGARDKRS